MPGDGERNLRAYKGITAVSNAASNNVRTRRRLHTVTYSRFLGILLAFGIFRQTVVAARRPLCA